MPLNLVPAEANRHDAFLLQPTLIGLRKLAPLPSDVTVHRDRAYDSANTRALLDEFGFEARSPARAYLRRSRLARTGLWSAPTAG